MFTALGVAGVVTALRLFSVALPNIAIDIAMDRGDAIAEAAELSERYGWGPPDDRSAASFGQADPAVQTYVELEGGGRDAFVALGERNVYQPYQWRVRRFAERRVEESVTRFTPGGDPYGFELRLAEDDPGDGNRSETEALALAEATAAEWGVDLGVYDLVESSQEALPGERIDHTFVYERTDEAVGDARFRLRIRIAGGRAAELTHFVQVPEAFSRQYADVRATNDSIALVSQAVVFIVFILLGAGVGSALLLRRGWLEWRTALGWGALIAFLFGLNTVNQLPLSWMAYDTALSATSFTLQQLGAGLAIGLLGTPLIGFFLLSGESLGRLAFPEHIQQWRFWSRDVASSTTALGMTAAAYLLVGLQVGYVVLFYLGTQRLEGWWSPAEALVQPDLLATYMPWLQAVSIALFASFWEESVFRAVPLACAALIGARLGRRGLWIWGAVVLQAVVFAAGHANYPQQPPYARVIELSVPALVWGIVYVRFGLVPTILAHYLYDLSLISVVLFESRALFDQGVIVAAALVPLGVVVRARAGGRARSAPPHWAYNSAWVPAVAGTPRSSGADVPDAPDVPTAPGPVTARRLPAWSVPAAAVTGLVLLVGGSAVGGAPPALWGDRDEAVSAATAELRARGAPVDEWTMGVSTASGATQGRDYAYREASAEDAGALEGTYFGTPQWMVRLVDWGADPGERVEEYRAWVGPGGEVTRVVHTLPEGRPGAQLDQTEARVRAHQAIATQLGLTPSALVEVEAEETSRPQRTDWTFTFTEPRLLTSAQGEARIRVRVAGDEVADIARFVYVPEEWERERRQANRGALIMTGGVVLLLLICFAAAAVAAIVVWSRGGLLTPLVWKIGVVVFLGLTASAANAWPVTAAEFVTTQPWGFQVAALAIALVLLGLIAGPAVGLVAALAHTWLPTRRLERGSGGVAVALGLLFAGVLAARAGLPQSAPRLADYSGAASALPMLDDAFGAVAPYLFTTTCVLVWLAVRERFADRPFVVSTAWALVIAVGIVAVPETLRASVPTWALGAVALCALLVGALRICATVPTLVPAMLATVVVVQSLTSLWTTPHVGARAGGVLAALVVGLLGWAWTREMARVPSVALGEAGLGGQ